MINKIFILVGLFSFLNFKSAAQCPDENLLVEKINYYKDTVKLSVKKFPFKERIEKLQSYLDTINNCPYKNDSTHANLLRTLAILYYYETDYFNAARYLRLSLELIVANLNKPSINRKPLLSGYVWLSSFYDSLNNIPEKMKAINNCIEIARKLNSFSDFSSVRALFSKTEHYFDIGDYHSCIQYSDLCEKFAWECANVYKTQPYYYNVARRLAMSSFGWHVEALLKLKEYKEAEELIRDKFDIIKSAGLNEYFGMIYDQLAQVEINKGDYAKAFRLLELAIKKNEQAGDYFNCKQTSSNIAYNVYFKILGDEKNALKYYQKALNYKNKNSILQHEDSMESVSIFNRIANLYINKNHFDSSDKYFQLAFDHFKKGSNENFILQIPSAKIKDVKKIDYIEVLLLDRADAYKKQYLATKNSGFLLKGIKAYKIADRFLDTIKIALTDLQSKLFWRSSAKRLYENAIEACYLQSNLNEAFYFFEKSRAVLLNDQLNEQRWINEEDILKETQLKKKIQQLERELNNSEPSSKRYSDLQDELFSSRQNLEQLQDIIKTNNPLYYQNFVEKNFITINDVKERILKGHQGLIELFAGDSAMYILAITSQNQYLKKIDKKLYDSLALKFTNYLSNSKLLNSRFPAFAQISYQLFSLIFQNINLAGGRVIISPDGRYFPFEALITNPQNQNYFLNDYAVSYTYSARYLLNNFQLNSISSSNIFFGIAPVKYSNGQASLTGSDQSLQRIKSYFSNATNFLLNQASRNNFLNEFSNYRIIQLYTHATDSGVNGEPMIYFFDTTLLLSDLFYGKRPATNLIVLSACQTALGKIQSGEGVFSFNRGFAALGIPSAVSNLWEVDDKATYKLTELFYKYVSRGLPLDVALQKAKIEFIKSSDTKLPYFWAASILVGQSNAIPLQKAFPWKWVTASITLLILGFWGWRIRKRYRQPNSG